MKKLFLILALLFPINVFGSVFSILQKLNNNTAGVTITLNSGSLVTVHIMIQSDTLASLSDGTNTYVHAANADAYNPTLNANHYIYYCLTASSGTFTITPSTTVIGSAYEVEVREYSVTGGPAIFDKATNDANTGPSSTSGSIVTANNNELVVTSLLFYPSPSTTPPSFANAFSPDRNIVWYDNSADLIDAGTAGTVTVSWGLGGSGYYAQGIVAFKNTGGGGGSTCPKTLTLLGVACDFSSLSLGSIPVNFNTSTNFTLSSDPSVGLFNYGPLANPIFRLFQDLGIAAKMDTTIATILNNYKILITDKLGNIIFP